MSDRRERGCATDTAGACEMSEPEIIECQCGPCMLRHKLKPEIEAREAVIRAAREWRHSKCIGQKLNEAVDALERLERGE